MTMSESAQQIADAIAEIDANGSATSPDRLPPAQAAHTAEPPSGAPRTGTAGGGKTPSGMGGPLKPSSMSARILMITEVSRRPSSRTTTRGPRSSGNWCSAWHRCYGDYAAPP